RAVAQREGRTGHQVHDAAVQPAVDGLGQGLQALVAAARQQRVGVVAREEALVQRTAEQGAVETEAGRALLQLGEALAGGQQLARGVLAERQALGLYTKGRSSGEIEGRGAGAPPRLRTSCWSRTWRSSAPSLAENRVRVASAIAFLSAGFSPQGRSLEHRSAGSRFIGPWSWRAACRSHR